jgi:ribonuclease HI
MNELMKYKVNYPNKFSIHDLEGIPIKEKTKNGSGAEFDVLLTHAKYKKLSNFKKNKPKLTKVYESNQSTSKERDTYVVYCDAGVFNHGYSLSDSIEVTFSCFSIVILKNNNEEIYKVSHIIDHEVTSNQAEIIAALFALRYLSSIPNIDNNKIIINSDSTILLDLIIDRDVLKKNIFKSMRENSNTTWNKYLLPYLTELSFFINMSPMDIYVSWVKGHVKDTNMIYTYNNMCDYMCNLAILKYIDSIELDDDKDLNIKKRRESIEYYKKYLGIISDETEIDEGAVLR